MHTSHEQRLLGPSASSSEPQPSGTPPMPVAPRNSGGREQPPPSGAIANASVARRRNPVPRRKPRWSSYVALVAIVMVISWSLQPYVAAAFDPARQAQVSVERVRAAEKVLTVRLAAIKSRYGDDHADKLTIVLNSADDFHTASDALRDLGQWLLQERGRIDDDMTAYVAAMETAHSRILAAMEQNKAIASGYPEGSEFRRHYETIGTEYGVTAAYLQQRVAVVRTQQQELDLSMDYIAEVLRFLDRMQIHVDVVSVRNSHEARRVQQYLATLSTFKTRFQEMMTLLGAEHVSNS